MFLLVPQAKLSKPLDVARAAVAGHRNYRR
jgi:hypothetical protein